MAQKLHIVCIKAKKVIFISKHDNITLKKLMYQCIYQQTAPQKK